MHKQFHEATEDRFTTYCLIRIQRLQEMAQVEDVSTMLTACETTKSNIAEDYAHTYLGLPSEPLPCDIKAHEDLKQALTLRMHRTVAFIDGVANTYRAWGKR